VSGSARPALLGIRHVALFFVDLEEAERFWVDVMGYEVEWRPDPDNVYLRGGSDNLALHRRTLHPNPLPTERGEGVKKEQMLDHIGLAVPTPGDVDAWATHLAGKGIALEAQPKTHRDGSRSLYFRAPGKLLVQIIHHVPMT
jgi:catechol 2,3-dioxygenase-like lactoylglutathione lyase family enzyme